MAEDFCYWNHYVKHCDYGNWHAKAGIELTIWPPSICLPTGDTNETKRIDTYKKLKDFYGMNYVKIGLNEDEYGAAIKAGWNVHQLSIWINKAVGWGTLRWHLNRIYSIAVLSGQDITNESLHSIYLEEPVHKSQYGHWFDGIYSCLTRLCGDNVFCRLANIPKCIDILRSEVDEIMKNGSQQEIDDMILDIFTLPYVIKHYYEFNVDPWNGRDVLHVHPDSPDVIGIEYDNSWILGGIDGRINLPYGGDGLDAIINDHYGCNTNEWRNYYPGSNSEIVFNIIEDHPELECLCEAYRIGYRKLLIFPGDDKRYDSCDQFWRRLNNFYLYLERCGFAERDYNCYPVLQSRWKCKYNPPLCHLCKKDYEHLDDWIWVPLENIEYGNTVNTRIAKNTEIEREEVEINNILGKRTLLNI